MRYQITLCKFNRIIMTPYLEIKITFSLMIFSTPKLAQNSIQTLLDANDEEGGDVLMTFKFTKGHY